MDKLLVGKIVKPQGIKGEVKVLSLADSPEVFYDLDKVFIDDVEYKILSARVSDGAYLALKGIADRNTAEEFRNKLVYANRDDLELPEGRYFITDVIGCEVFFEDGKPLGKVEDITTRGSTDIFTVIMRNGKTVMFPFLNELVLSVDVEKKSVVLKEEKLAGVALYED